MCMLESSVAMNVAGSAMGFAQQAFGASNQNRFTAQNRKLAYASAANQFNQLNQRVNEETSRMSEAVRQVREESLLAKSQVSAGAAESGVTGNSIDALLEDFERQEGQFVAAQQLNLEYARSRAEMQKQGIGINTHSSLLSSADSPGPNIFGGVLNAASGGLGTYIGVQSQLKAIG